MQVKKTKVVSYYFKEVQVQFLTLSLLQLQLVYIRIEFDFVVKMMAAVLESLIFLVVESSESEYETFLLPFIR